MKIEIKNKYLVVVIIALTLGVYVFGGYMGRKKANRASLDAISALTDTINTYKYKYGKVYKLAREREQLIIRQRDAIKQGLIDKAELKALHLKSVNEVTSLKGQIQILKDSIAHNGTVIIVTPCDSIGEPKPMIELPFAFKEENSDYRLNGGFDVKGKMNIDLFVPLSLDVWTGQDKKTKEYKAVVTSTNPVVKITEIKSYKFDLPKQKKFGIGIQCGYGVNLIGDVRANPYLGLGASYNLITF